MLGQAELWAASRLLGTTGAHILAVFLALAGVVLLSGGSLAAAIRHGGVRVARAALATVGNQAAERPQASHRSASLLRSPMAAS